MAVANAAGKAEKPIWPDISPMGIKTDYLRAREHVRDRGGLPGHAAHDKVLTEWESISTSWSVYYSSAFARELLVYPERDGTFNKWADVMDHDRDYHGRSVVIPASSIPQEATGIKGVGLLFDPQNIHVEKKRVVFESNPNLVVILNNFIQLSRQIGKVDGQTGIPTEVSREELASLDESQKRSLFRIAKQGIRPIVRMGSSSYRNSILADEPHGTVAGVFYTLQRE